jgi:CheY-like chemotaxis protein
MTAYSLLTIAEQALDAGISVVPPRQDGTKAPLGSWRTFQERLPYLDELDDWYRAEQNQGIGVVCGAVSGNLEALDFDRHSAYEEFVDRARETGLSELVDRIEAGYLEKTPKGRHWLWRCSEISGNTKLANNEDQEVLIETRGEGGYVILAPSSGSIHPSGEPYELLSGSIDTISAITPEERESLLDLARSFDYIAQRADLRGLETDFRPGDHFNAETTWSALLVPEGWQEIYTRNTITYWRRPGKTIGISASSGLGDADLFYVFTTSTIFDGNAAYSKFGAYALLHHHGDYSAAAAALRADGFGAPTPIPLADPADASPLASAGFHFSSWSELLAEPAETQSWLWDQTLATSSISILVSRPKVGKSTLARSIAVAVATGGQLLGREVAQGTILYLQFSAEGKRSELKQSLERAGATLDDRIWIYTGPTVESPIEALEAALAQHRPSLVVIDTMIRWVPVNDANDYTEMSRVTEAIATMARLSGSHIMMLHHASKADRDAGDAVLGSTAIFGAVDTLLAMRSREGRRTLETRQRYGDDMEETVLDLDLGTGLLMAAGSLEEVEQRDLKAAIMAHAQDGMNRQQIVDGVEGRAALISKALRQLTTEGHLERLGAGTRSDPTVYLVHQEPRRDDDRGRIRWRNL